MIPTVAMALGRLRRSVHSIPERGPLAQAVRDAGRFDRRGVSASGGLLAAIPVVVVLALGRIAWSAVAGVTMGAGAMLIGIAWRLRGGRPRLAVLATDAVVMAMATFVGSVTGSVSWLHLAVLFVWALLAGLLVVLGPRGGVIGTQSVVAFVVFGRFSQPAPAAAGLGALVLAGACAQVAFQSIVRWPPPLRFQRTATAAAYRALASLAAAGADTSTLPAATALDEAQDTLASPALFGDPALMTLRSLVGEGHRVRVELSALQALTAPQRPEHILALTARVLELIAAAIEGGRGAAEELRAKIDELTTAVDEFAAAQRGPGLLLARRLAALAGQLRAAAALASAAGESGSLRDRRPQRPANRLRERLAEDAAQLRANASLQSPAGRHAVRLAVVVVVAEVIARHLPLQRSYWMVLSAATTLRPEFGATFTRGAERLLGTTVGVILAGAIAVALHPGGVLTIALVGLLAWAGYATFPASFAAGFTFVVALVVFLLNVISPDTLATAWARLLDTVVGGALGLLAYAVWPTWSDRPARQALAELLAAGRAYLAAILTSMARGGRADGSEMRQLSRRARLARTTAEATVARSLSEPATRRIDAEESQQALAAMRRLVQSAHVLRLDSQEDRPRPPMPALEPLATGLDSALKTVEASLRATRDRSPSATRLPDLRTGYATVQRSLANAGDRDGLLLELDEIVDAANGLAELVGFAPAGDARPPAERDLKSSR
jgi:uncharacterized membrane protein YccC